MADSTAAPTLRAVVTGASSGIGAATVRLLRAHGWQVTAVARRADRLAALADETGCAVVVADLTSADDVDALAERVRAAGPLHALVANAGGAIGTDPVATVAADTLAGMFELNVLTAQRAIAALLPSLRLGAVDRGSGDIVAVTSTAGQVAYEGGGGYNAAKFALRGLLGALRLELAGEPLRVVQIAPGMVRTEEFAAKRFGGDQEKVDALYAGVEHPLLAEDVAEAIVHAIELPSHVNLDEVIIRPVAQAAQHKLVREPLRVRES
ncbi:SDR family oxidoreductase [Microcella alkalica]|uniref:NADP-dependent 3-hydroxy acid dehydrogenase YdfG n=1 Tax=Microcella alkalica TaxID=355930 RepID=A0A839E227_9MICO|nr:SDR family oxidoreductase [Microcella alkalica]MBA8846729.1 NADP-dependent 3-hydroxy acid dehydrogenase YdfG [Microcella alkalica]